MNSIKMMLVEDDFVVRRGIHYSVEWEAYGIDICAEAVNGRDGLLLAEEHKPDLIITDIRMPIMDGLQFTEKLRSIQPDTCVVILSGYDDFVYAKQAIHMGVNEYLLKPIDADELLKCVIRLRDEICARKKENARQSNQQNLVESLRPEIHDNLLQKLVHTSFAKKTEKILDSLAYYEIIFEAPEYLAVILAVENYLLLTRNHTEEERLEINSGIRGIIRDCFEGFAVAEAFENENHQFGILLNFEPVSDSYLKDRYVHLISRIQSEIGFICAIACGTRKTSAKELCISYQEAVTALRGHLCKSNVHVFEYDTSLKTQKAFLEIQEEEKKLIENIQRYDSGKVQESLADIFRKAVQEGKTINEVKEACIRLISAVFSCLNEMNVPLPEKEFSYSDILTTIQSSHTLHYLQQYLSGFLLSISKVQSQLEQNKYSQLVKKAIEYTEKHYSEALSVKTISMELFITPNYFSQIFKSQTGDNYTDYVNKVRVHHAIALLKDPRRKVYEVAEQVGYQNYKYFNTVFKKVTGLSPKEYRNQSL